MAFTLKTQVWKPGKLISFLAAILGKTRKTLNEAFYGMTREIYNMY